MLQANDAVYQVLLIRTVALSRRVRNRLCHGADDRSPLASG